GIELRPDFYVDLEQVRNCGSLDALLGRTTRKHLRQNVRDYERSGPIQVEEARSLTRAHSMLERMADMDQQTLRSRGHGGGFASSRFRAFHRAFLERCHPQGKALLLQVSAGARIVGIVYALLHRGRVYHYQSGFDYASDPRLSPGMVTLYHAIQHCADGGLRE